MVAKKTPAKKSPAKKPVKKTPAKKVVTKTSVKKVAKKAPAAQAVKKSTSKPAVKKNSSQRIVKKTVAKKSVAKKTASQAPAKKAPVKKASATKAPVKKSAAKKAPAKNAPVKKAVAKKVVAKKVVAKKVAPKPATKQAQVKKDVPKKTTKTAVKKAESQPVKDENQVDTHVVSEVEPTPPPKKVFEKLAPVKNPPVKGKTPPGITKVISPRADSGVKVLAVREDESPWTKAELRAVRQELLDDETRILEEIATAELGLADLIRDSGDGAGDDQADAGSKTFEREHEMSLANNAREMLEQVRHALGRIEDGSYGVCEGCAGPVGKLRLQAFPRATLCMACKIAEERY